MTRKFQKTKEDFVCENCGNSVAGNGYTNHCPRCLWSKHVDLNPGDRGSVCQGMMEPARIEMKGQEQVILHKCIKCGLEKRNKTVEEDNLQTIMGISSQSIFK